MDSEPEAIFTVGNWLTLIFGGVVSLGVYWVQEARRKRVESDLKAVQAKQDQDARIHQASLERSLHVAKINFEREYGIYQDMWSKAVALRRVVFDLRPSSTDIDRDETEDQRFERKRLALNEAYKDFVLSIDNNLPFYQREVYVAFERVRAIAEKEAFEYRHQIEGARNNRFDPDSFDKAGKNQKALLNAVDEACELIRARFNPEATQPKDSEATLAAQ